MKKHLFVFWIMASLLAGAFFIAPDRAFAMEGATTLIAPQVSQPAEEPEKYVSVQLIADQTQGLTGEETITLGIVQRIAPGWHIYWKNPGDSGAAAEVEWNAPDTFIFSDLEWPVPKKLPFGPLMNFGYENIATNFVTLTLPENIPPMPFQIGMNIDLLVCEEICIPESHQASIVLNGTVPPSAEIMEEMRNSFPSDKGWDAAYSTRGSNFILSVTVAEGESLQGAKDFELFPEEWGLIENVAESSANIDGNVLTITQAHGERDFSEVPMSKMVIRYTDGQNIPRGVRVSAMLEGASASDIAKADGASVDIFLWQALLFAVLGGLILNLMPCVFPVLSMKALSLCKLKDKEEAKARLSGLAYTAGVLVSFAVIAGALLAFKAAGAEIGWGFQLQNPFVISLLATLLFVIGLNLAGLFDFSGRFAGIGSSLVQKEGASGSFFTGVLATLVATPCTAPFMGVAMGFALTQPALISMSVFLMLGFGLALPYLLLAYIPALRHVLPKPGPWMERFKELLAFPMFASAAWLVWVLSQQAGSIGVLILLMVFVALAFAIWTFKNLAAQGALRWIGLSAAIIALIFSAFCLSSLHGGMMVPGQSAGADQNWESFSEPVLEGYLEDGYPVFVNMTAAWCITCKVNERIALDTNATRKLFETRGIKYLKGDWTNQDPEITKYLDRYGRTGVPLYVYYGPRDENGARPEPKLLPQILTPAIVEGEITGS